MRLMVFTFLCLSTSFATADQAEWIQGPPGEGARLLIQKAVTFRGIPYVIGGADRKGVDCSGFISAAYEEALGKAFTRSVFEQARLGDLVEGPLLPGDLIFFNTTGVAPSHVGIYLGDGQVIHAASQGSETGVIVSHLDEPYYKKVYLFARRIFTPGTPVLKIRTQSQPVTWAVPQRIKAPGRFNLELVAPEFRGQDLVFQLLKEGKPVLRHRRPIETESVLDRFTLGPGNWTFRIQTPAGKPEAEIKIRVRSPEPNDF